MKRTLAALLLLTLAACKRQAETPLPPLKPASPAGATNAERGKQLMTQYTCNACHVIPGVDGGGMIGPSLEQMASRPQIANKFPNDPATMSRWLQNPQALDPNTTMPNLGVNEKDAQDMAAYLATLR
ncbi:MAG: c-type cytochrome [Acidobacteria bacterium]|nr:c-type cytochrome [Acidobacteriota bacterium]